MKFSMFSSPSSTNKIKVKVPGEQSTPKLSCLLNGPFKELHFNISEHRVTPVHDVVFLDDIDNSTVTPLVYRNKRSTSPVAIDDLTKSVDGLFHKRFTCIRKLSNSLSPHCSEIDIYESEEHDSA